MPQLCVSKQKGQVQLKVMAVGEWAGDGGLANKIHATRLLNLGRTIAGFRVLS